LLGVQTWGLEVLKIFNLIEALLWAGVAAGVLIFSKRLADRRRRIAYVAAAAFLLFGVSDLVEIYTGAWWKPVWLLLWKAGCIAGLLTCLTWYWRAKRQ
jgi:hypothetical protein